MTAEPLPEPLGRLHDAHVRAWRDLDVAALGAIYDEACLIFDTYPPPVYRGWPEFRDRIAPELDAFESLDLTTFDHTGELYGDVGWIACRYRIDGRRADGPYRGTGRWTEVYARRKHGWRLIHLHSSVDPVGQGGSVGDGRD